MGQSTVNFFDINNKKRDKSGTYTTMSSSNTTGSLSNVPSETNKYTNQMALLDKELEEEGLKIERLSEQEKWNYVNSLTDTEYQRMNQYKDAGYSFGASRALLELEKQSQGGGQGGTKAEAYQTFEPIGGKNSIWNLLNVGGRLTERIDDEVQENLVEPLSFGQREKRSQALRDKYDALTEEDLKEREAKFEKEPNRRKKLYKTGTDEKTGEPIYDLTKYWQEHNKSFLDTIWGADLVDSYNIGGIEVPNISVTNMVANAPGSTLGTASATLRGVTNPLDNVAILAKLFFSKEGHEILKSRYGTFGNFVRSAEQDPIGVDSDILAVAGVGTKAGGYGAGIISGGSRIAGATERASRWSRLSKNLKNLSNRLEGASDLGISVGYEAVLDKTLSKLAQGNKGSNLLGDYISFSQRPLRTIREGADPSKNKNEQVTVQETEQVNTPANDPWDDSWITEYEEETKVTLPDTLEKPVNWTDKNGVRQAGTRKMMIESLATDGDTTKVTPESNMATAQGYDPDTAWALNTGGEKTVTSDGKKVRVGSTTQIITAEEGRYFDWIKNNKQNVSSSPSTSNNWTYGGIQDPVNKIVNGIKERIQVEATGLTPEVRERIRQNPYIKEYWDKTVEMINEEGAPMDNQKIKESAIEEVGNELLRRLREYEARLEDDGEAYSSLRESQVPYNFSDFMNGVYRVFSDNGITVTPEGDLSFSTTANPADMNPVNTAWYVIKSMEPNLSNMTPSQFLDFRKQLRSLINYESDSRSTRYSKKIIRQLVDGELNKLGHKEIPGLEKIDKIYHDALNELKSFKDGLVYQVGEKKGQIKDNFYSILTTINTQNRQKMKARVEKLYPDLGERVEAINMLPTLAKTYQSSPKMMKALFEKAGFLGGIRQSGGIKKAVIGWLLGIVADELFAKPLGEKRRKKAIDDLINEVSPEAMQKLANIKSKADAGIELTEQEKQDLATALQEIAIKEYEYLDEKHKKAFDEILESANNDQPKLPAPGMDTIGPDGIVRLGMGNQLNSPENPTPKTREERVQQMQQEYEVEPQTAEEMTDRYEDFMDDIGGDINGEINPREVSYERFSTRTLEKLMDDDMIPRTEKDKIEEILIRRGMEAEVEDDRSVLDHKFAYEINKLSEREKKILSMKSKKKSEKEYLKLEEEKERLKEKMGEQYNDQSKERVEEKYADLESKPIEYINEYKKSKTFKEDQAEKQVLDKLRGEWSKQPKFIREMDGNMAGKRQEIVDKPLQNGYERQTTDVGDRFINKQTGDKGAIKYNEDGTIEVVFTEESFKNSGVMDILPADAVVRFAGEPDTIKAGELRGDEYQTVGRANPDQETITAEEGLNLKSFKGDKTIGELADEYGLKRQIVEKIFTSEGEEALGRARGDLIELVKEIKEGTAPHEVFHPIFNMVNAKRRAEIIDLVRKNKGITEGEAKEWLAESFGDYFLTGKFDTKPIPKGFVNKVKWFFNKVKEFINGTWRSRKKVQKLFDDIMEGKIERGEIESNGWEYQEAPYDRKLTPEQKEQRATKMFRTRDGRYAGFDHEAMINYFNNDLGKWMDTVKEKAHKDYSIDRFVDYYLTLKALQNDPNFVEGLGLRSEKITKPGNVIYGTDNLTKLDRLFKNEIGPLKRGDGSGEIKVSNEELLEPIRRWLMENDVSLETLRRAYSPDTIQWQNNLSTFDRVPVSELKRLQKYVEDLYEKGEEIDKEKHRLRSAYPIEGDDPNMAIYTIGQGIGETFAEKRIKEITNDMWSDVMDPMGDIIKSALAGSTEPLTPAKFNEFAGHIYYDLGQTYSPDIKEWSKAVEEEIKARADRMGISLNRKKVIPEQKLQGLGAKLKEMLAMGKDLGEYITSEANFDYNPTRSEWIRDLVNGAYENSQKGEATKGIETTKQLVALSNMSLENFKKQIEDFGGKSPMPSIAVTDVNVPHTAFGDLTVIFGRDTVDPQIDPRNKLYASDAWTQTFPDIEETGGIRYSEATELMQKLKDKINKVDSLTLTEGGLDPATIDSLVNRIANEILRNGSDAEYLAGYLDVAETSVENAVDDIGLERADNEGLYLDLERIVEDYVKEHQIRQVIPARYFKGRVRYQDFNAIDEIVDKVYNNLPEKGKQKLKDDGWNFDETDSKYVINQKYNDAPPKQGLERDLMDVIEKIEDRPNNTPTEAGREYRDLLVDEYGFDRSLATQIAEDIFGQIEAERLTPEGFADKLSNYMPLNDGDMGFDFGEMDRSNLDAMNGDVESMNRQVGRRILEERDEQKNNVDGPQAMNKIIDTLLDEREENTHEIIENYVTVDLREKAIGDDPSVSEENKRWQTEGKKQVEEIMGGVDASLTDMKLWVKDIANQEMLIEELNRDRPLTPENILEAMKGQGGPRRENAEGTLRDLVGVEGKEFTDIEQVRGKNLAKTTHNDRTGDLSAIEKRYNTIIDEIRRMFTESEPDVPMEMSTQVVRQEIAWNYDSDLETFRSNLEEENPMWDMVPDDYLQAIIDAVEMGKQVPVRFSESKPERIVDLYNEVQYILVPKESYKETQRIVKGTPLEGKVHMYDRSGFKAERSNKIKQLQRKYGNIFFSMGGAVMPIAMLLMMMQGEDEGEGQQA